ncbi:MAG: lysophospholipid acyltransferase family protein [Aureliella sp.]
MAAALKPERMPNGGDASTAKRAARRKRGQKRAAASDFFARLTGNTIILLARFFSGYTVRWVDCQPDTCQRVYFANHTSHLDAVVLWSALPGEIRALTRPVAAKDYWGKTAWKRHLAKAFNALLIDRREIKVHQSPVDLMIREIGDVNSLIVFPEGGRADDGQMGEFKSGIYYLAKKRPDLELVPVYMENLNRILPRGEVVPIPLLSSIHIGEPIFLEAGEPKVDFLRRARQAVVSLSERD